MTRNPLDKTYRAMGIALSIVTAAIVVACWWTLSKPELTSLDRCLVAINFPVAIFASVMAARMFRGSNASTDQGDKSSDQVATAA